MPGTNLTRDEAAERSSLIGVDHYQIDLDVTTSETTFTSRTTIRFSCARPGASTFVDLIATSVERIALNGVELDPATRFGDSRIALSDLAADNELVVEATCAFTNSGEGLHRFVDPVDGEVYLYSQFEVPDSRRVFAVFEQPDLKATFAFAMTAPDHWQVVSNSPTPQPVPTRDGVARWAFEATPRMSSYVTAVVAGPFDVVTDRVTARNGEIPLGIYCRRSLTRYLDAEAIFAVTKAGFGFFEEQFDCAYPFAKYDQLFCPEFNAGAMENAGCVTITEMYIFRSAVPEALVERRALTILHELAHMWFGDLVTMRWWNDLWLNESFAEWASTTCQAEATQWRDAWTTFCTHEKSWAYAADQLSSTHPVVAPIRDLSDVEVNFDGITYAKGAAVLKQLVAYVGREPFQAGLRAYFAEHAWDNTTLPDLLRALETASGRDLTPWTHAWLETAGVNTLRPLIDVDDDGVIRQAAISQSYAAGYETLRPHRLAIGLYDAGPDGTLRRADQIELDVEGEQTEVPQLVGRARPDLLLVNDDDLTYAKIRLDEASLETVLANPRGLTQSLPRALVLAAAWDMTRDAELPARRYVDLVLATLPGEDDSTLLRTLLSQLQLVVTTYVAPDAREGVRQRALAVVTELTGTAAGGSDAQLQLLGALCQLLRPGDDTALVRGLLDGSATLPERTIDTDLRWTLLTALAATGDVDSVELDAQLDADNTATGRERHARALASRPTAEAKRQAWQRAVVGNDLANSMVNAYALGFTHGGTQELLGDFVTPYHDALVGLSDEKGSHAIIEAIVRGFYPRTLASQELEEATQRWLDAHPQAPAGLRRLVAENRDAMSRALAAQQFDLGQDAS